MEFFKENRLSITTIVYAVVVIYVIYSGISQQLSVNILLLMGLFILIAYTLLSIYNMTDHWTYIAVIVGIAAIVGILPYINSSIVLFVTSCIIAWVAYKYKLMSPLKITIVSLIALVLAWWSYNKLHQHVVDEVGKTLLREPVNLSTIRTVADNVHEQTNNYHYSVSFWTFIHNQPHKHRKYVPIFDFGGKPLVEYNGAEEKLRVKFGDGKPVYEGKIAPQKWINVVVAYDRGVVDVFIDAQLVATKSGIVPYMSNDIITVGENDGISGGIKDVVYYPQTVRKSTIDRNYAKYRS